MNNENIDEAENRKHPRTDFSFPVKISVYSQDFGSKKVFDGYIQNMSMIGACIHFDDKYGRIDMKELKGARVKLAIKVPRGEDVVLNAEVQWVRKEKPDHSFSIMMGIELREIAEWQVEQIEKFIHLRNKDHKMLWSLLDQYLE